MIRWLLRALGTLALLAALAAFGNELERATTEPGYRLVPLGELWAWLHANSLIGFQARVEAASPWLWRAIVLPILMGPAWAFPLGLGLVLRAIGARARRHGGPSRARRLARLARALHQPVARAPAGPTAPSAHEAPPPERPASTSPPRARPAPRREPTIIRPS